MAKARVRAERRFRELLYVMQKAKGARGNSGGRGARIVPSNETRAQKTLKEQGLTKKAPAVVTFDRRGLLLRFSLTKHLRSSSI